MSEHPCGWCGALDAHELDCPAVGEFECTGCGVPLDNGEGECPDCHDGEWWEPDEDAVPVVDVPVGEYL